MRDFTGTYPVKLLSRTLPAARTNKLRISWFVLGVAFGIGCAQALTPVLPNLLHKAELSTLRINYAAQDVLGGTMKLATQDIIAAKNDAAAADTKLLEKIIAGNTNAAITEAPPPNVYPLAVDVKVESGDTLTGLLTDAGVSYEEAQNVAQAVRNVYDVKRLDIGKNIQVTMDKTPDAAGKPLISSVLLPVNALSTIEIKRAADNGFNVKKVDAPVSRQLARAGGRIDSSLYQTGVDSGIPASLINEIISAYSYDVDFQRDIKQGDAMDVLFEQLQTKDGTVAGNGNVVYTELQLGNRTLRLYRYVDKDGHADYYTDKGESVRKALLRTPINGAQITSGYGMRMHPLLGYTRMHRGIDFGAPIGTPIYAAGDGIVEFVGKKAGYGNYIRIKHNDKYSSAYAHCSRFAAHIAPGTKVKQGQVIAYVGMTGMATGPHLHYEILVNNEQVNPSNVKFKTGNVLAGKDMLAFRKTMESVQQQLASMPRNGSDKVAMVDTPKVAAAD